MATALSRLCDREMCAALTPSSRHLSSATNGAMFAIQGDGTHIKSFDADSLDSQLFELHTLEASIRIYDQQGNFSPMMPDLILINLSRGNHLKARHPLQDFP